MNKKIEELIIKGLGDVITSTADPEVLNDKEYQKLCKEAEDLYEEIMAIGLCPAQVRKLKEYTELINSAGGRACDIYYLTGARNTIMFLHETKAIKNLSKGITVWKRLLNRKM